ncbi:hypothetical protein AAF712_010823 [Marasmius tenuissimus]|uniref:F-box domain-containing protein n=1 Tax=Marasmius tenuissimus TaxID=585030 RepID=A0ABR2ZMX5_9AGAR
MATYLRVSQPQLPYEVLSQVFLHAKSDNTLNSRGTQWALGGVSRHWRHVSLGTARLWNTVKVIPNRSYRHCSPKEYEAMLRKTIRRSGGKILNVYLDVTYLDPLESQQFLSLLFSTSDTWTTFTLRSTQSTRRAQWDLDWKTSGFPSLQVISIDDLRAFARRHWLLLALENSPKLESVSMFRREFRTPKPSSILPSLPYCRLTLLEVDPPQEIWCLQAMERCKSLSTLVVRRDVLLGPDTELTSRPISLPTVRRLQLSLERNDKFRSQSSRMILDLLSLPSLTEISISEGEKSIGSSLIDATIRLIERSHCSNSLQSISIHDITLRDYTIERLLSKTPNITTLSLHGFLFPRLFTSIASSGSGIVPNLQHLTVSHPDKPHGAFPSSSTIESITEMIGARQHTLQSLHLNVYANSVDQGPLEKLKRKAQFYRLSAAYPGGAQTRLHFSVDYRDMESSDSYPYSDLERRYRFGRPSEVYTRVKPLVKVIQAIVRHRDLYASENVAENLPLLDDIVTVVEGFDVDYSECAKVSNVRSW